MDTFFIVVHKKKLIFLHWYHHITVLLFSWHCYTTKSPTGLFYCSINFGVHAVMYFYYFLMAVHLKPKWFNPLWLTVAQILQMVVGVAVTSTGLYIEHIVKPDTCATKTENNVAGLLLYGSYFVLFSQFFIARYLQKGPKAKLKFF